MYEYGNELLDDQQLEFVWKEINLIFDQMVDQDKTGTAVKDGKSLKSGKGFLVEDNLAKFVMPTISSVAEHFMHSVPDANKYTLLVNYYGDGDYYEEHKDDSIKTLNVMLCQNEQQFTGGEFVFTEENITIPFENNSYVIFDGKMPHKVNTVNLNKQEFKNGRFTLTYFFYKD